MLSEDPTTYELPILSSANEFEELCLELWRRVWADPNIQRLGSSGQEQHGIDIFSHGPGSAGQIRAIQCKKYWRTRLTNADIDEIVADVKTSPLMPISELVIATTSPREARIQEHVAAVTRENAAASVFSVQVFSWDDIRSLLHNYTDVLRMYYPGMFAPSVPNILQAVSFANVTDVLLKDVKNRLANRDFDMALQILDELEEKQPVMDDITRFRVLTNRGVILSRMGHNAESAQCLLQAYAINKTSIDAGTNAAQACFMIDDKNQAAEIARAVIRLSPTNSLAYRVLVLGASSLAEARSMLEDMPASVKVSGDILFALGAAAQRESDWDAAVSCFQGSIDAYGRNDPAICAFLAAAIMEQARHTCERDPELSETPHLRASVARAQELISSVIDYPGEVPDQLLSSCYSNRCHARIWLGDLDGAAQDAEVCIKRDPNEPENKRLLAVTLYLKHDSDKAIDSLRSIEDYRSVPEALDLLARLLYERGDFEEALNAIARFLALPEKPRVPTALAHHFRIRLLLKLNRTADAQTYTDDLLASEPEEPLWIADACWCACTSGVDSNDPSLRDRLQKLIALTTPGTAPVIRDHVSEIMDAISRPDLGVLVDEVAFSVEAYDTRSRRLLHRYLSLGRFSDAKDMCDRLIQSGAESSEVYWYRAQLDVRSGALDEAEGDLQSSFSLAEKNREQDNVTDILLLLAEVQIQNQHKVDALKSAQTVDASPNLTPVQFDRLIALWMTLGEYAQAIKAAYNRLFDPIYGTAAEIYVVYMRCFFVIDRLAPGILEPDETVTKDSGVLLKLPSSEQCWYVQDPVRRTRMGNVVFLSPDDQLWQRMLGKSAGDTVPVNPVSSPVSAAASIVQIAGRYAVILDECFTSFARQYPGRNEMERVPLMSSADPTSTSEQFQRHIADTATFGSYVRRILAAQRSGEIPFSEVSRLLNRNIVELFQDIAATDGEYLLAARPGLPPQVCPSSVTTLVVDPLSSLILAGIPAFHGGISARWSVAYTRATLDRLVEAAQELAAYVQHGMKSMVSLDGVHFTIVETPPGTVQRRLSQVSDAIAWLKENASVTPCNLILEYGEQKYQQAVSVIGRAETESIALAQEPGHALVSDELVLRLVASSERAASLSSQDVLQSARDDAAIAISDYAAGLLYLYTAHVRPVYFDASTLVSLCESAHWDAQLLPPDFFDVLDADNLGNAGPVIAGKLAREISMNVKQETSRNMGWWPPLLSAVAHGRSQRQAFEAMLQSMDTEFHHLAPLAIQELQRMIVAWLRTNIVI